MTNVIELAQKLVQYQSHQPRQFPIFAYMQSYLEVCGFNTRLFELADDNNQKMPGIYASYGQGDKHLLFAGHLDVTSLCAAKGAKSLTNGTIQNGQLYARGICDMKGAVACFISACNSLIEENNLPGKVSILLTVDEEKRDCCFFQQMLEQLTAEGEKFDFCLFGSPSNANQMGETIKIGGRGSLWFEIKSFGQGGHPGYHTANKNPLHNLLALLSKLNAMALDGGNEIFSPSTLQIMSVQTENKPGSEFPLTATAMILVFYNNNHNPENIVSWMQRNVSFSNGEFEVKYEKNKKIYHNTPEQEIALLKEAVKRTSGIFPVCGTDGAPSSAGSISNYCPVVEFGLTNSHAFRVNEAVKLEDIYLLEVIYRDFIKNYFADFNEPYLDPD